MVCEIHPVTDEVDQHIVLVSVLFDLSQPWVHILEWLTLCHVINHYGGLTIFVEQFRDWAELFLASGVPNLQFDRRLPINFHYKCSKFDADSDLMIILEDPLSERLHETALAHTWIADNDHLEKPIRVYLLLWIHDQTLRGNMT